VKQSERIAEMILDNVLVWCRGGGNYESARKDIIAIVDGVLTPHPEYEHCVWFYDDSSDCYHTKCGKDWCFPDGMRSENDCKFCPVCGKEIKEGGAE